MIKVVEQKVFGFGCAYKPRPMITMRSCLMLFSSFESPEIYSRSSLSSMSFSAIYNQKESWLPLKEKLTKHIII